MNILGTQKLPLPRGMPIIERFKIKYDINDNMEELLRKNLELGKLMKFLKEIELYVESRRGSNQEDTRRDCHQIETSGEKDTQKREGQKK